MTSGGEIDHVTFPRALIGATSKLMKLVVLSISFMVQITPFWCKIAKIGNTGQGKFYTVKNIAGFLT